MMFDWLRSWGRKAQGQMALVSPWLRSVVWTISRSFLALAREGYGQNSIVYACLRLLSQSVPEAALVAAQVGPDRERTPLPPDHPLAALIRAPNPLMTEYEMLELIVLHLGIVGRSHWWKQRDRAGRVAALWPLRPDRVGPRYGGGGDDDPRATDARLSVLGGWTYVPPGGGDAQFIPLDDMLSFNFPDPAGETGGIVEGLGWVQVLAREIETDNEATTFVGSLLKNDARPSAILKVKQPGISKDAAERIKRLFGSQFGGAQRGMTAVLDADTEYLASGFNLQQLEFPDLRNIAESRIAAAAGVPAVLVGLKVGIDAGIKATITEQRQYFSETTLANYWRRLADQFTNDLAAEFGEALACHFDTSKVKALAEHAKNQLQPIHDGFVGGAVKVDEYRTLYLNLPAVGGEYGNSFLVPNTSTASASLVPPPVAADDSPVPGKVRRIRPAAKGADPAHVKAVRKAADERTAAHAEAAVAGLTTYLAELGTAVVKRVEAHATTKGARKALAVDDGSLIEPEDTARLLELVTGAWSAVLPDAASDAAALTGADIPGDPTDAEYKAIFDGLADRVQGIDATTKAAIQAAVQAANAEGEGMPELAARLRALGAFDSGRAMMVARTESAVAYNLLSVAAYRASGVVTTVEVLDGEDDGPCADADGSVWTLDRAAREPLQHPNCTRAFAPIVDAAKVWRAA